MTKQDFAKTLESLDSGKRNLVYMVGEERAHMAITKALEKGHRKFKSAKLLRNFIFATARGMKRQDVIRGERHKELLTEYWRGLSKTDSIIDITLDIERATSNLKPDLRYAIHSYLLEEADIETAVTFLDNPRNGEKRINAVLTRLLNGSLRAYVT